MEKIEIQFVIEDFQFQQTPLQKPGERIKDEESGFYYKSQISKASGVEIDDCDEIVPDMEDETQTEGLDNLDKELEPKEGKERHDEVEIQEELEPEPEAQKEEEQQEELEQEEEKTKDKQKQKQKEEEEEDDIEYSGQNEK